MQMLKWLMIFWSWKLLYMFLFFIILRSAFESNFLVLSSRLDALLRGFILEESFFPFIGHDELSISSVQIKFSRDGVSSLRVIKSEFSRAIGEARQGKAGRVMARGRKKGSWGKGKKQRGEGRGQEACRARTRQWDLHFYARVSSEISVVARVFLVAGLLFGHATKNRRSF